MKQANFFNNYSTNFVAPSKPSTISLGCNPILIKLSAYSKSSPAKVITKLVLSPHSSSYIFAAITTILAAGCYTSNSFIIVAASLVTKILSR